MTDPDFQGYAIFCDDIRREVGGKLSFMGVYHGFMYIHGDFPFILPKFAIAVRYMEKLREISDPATLRIFLPGDPDDKPTIEGAMPMDEARKQPLAPGTDPNSTLYTHLGMDVVLSPLILQKEGAIRVRVQCGKELVKLGRLAIVRGEQTGVQVTS